MKKHNIDYYQIATNHYYDLIIKNDDDHINAFNLYPLNGIFLEINNSYKYMNRFIDNGNYGFKLKRNYD